MTRERQISKREKEIADEMEVLRKEKDEIRSRKLWRCYGCGKKTQVNKLTVVQDHWYVQPYSCNGGDYWKTSEELFVPCPKCDTINRVCDSFVQIRSVTPVQTINESKTYDLLSNSKNYVREVLNYFPRGSDHMITHNQIEELREKKQCQM